MLLDASTDHFPVGPTEEILEKLKTDKATESMKQKFLQSLGRLRENPASEFT